MPLQSREVVTVRLILDCDCGDGLEETNAAAFHSPTSASPLTRGHSKTRRTLSSLPPEIRLEILRYLLRFDCNRQYRTRRVPKDSIDHMLHLDSRRILEAPQFRHKSKQEINGGLPIYHTCHIQPAIMRTCRLFYHEGQSILYGENKIVAVQCGIRGLGARFRNFGVPVFGPFEAQRLIRPSDPKTAFYETFRRWSQALTESGRAPQLGFAPVVLFQGKKSKSDAPFFICSLQDSYNLIHALWILVKSPFAKGMRFHVTLANDCQPQAISFSDVLTRQYLLPWLHEHIESLDVLPKPRAVDPSARHLTMPKLLKSHHTANADEPNVYSYITICEQLESLLHQADYHVAQQHFLGAEALYERVCYEACSMVRTRTGKLVDVSTKVKDGINRVCKLIAISAFRLCELRSGAIVKFKTIRSGTYAGVKSSISECPSVPADSRHVPFGTGRKSDMVHPNPKQLEKSTTSRKVRTTRLEEPDAVEHALMGGLLALRLPCATPVPEWNIRINTILLDLFQRQKDWDSALSCIRRLQQSFNVLVKEARAKNKKTKQELLEAVITALNRFSEPPTDTVKLRTKEVQELVAHSHDVARRLWGERLMPRKGYVGLIWTFRWA